MINGAWSRIWVLEQISSYMKNVVENDFLQLYKRLVQQFVVAEKWEYSATTFVSTRSGCLNSKSVEDEDEDTCDFLIIKS